MKKILKVIKKIMDIVCWVLIIVFAATIVISFAGKITGNTPTFFGYSIYRVSTGSMEPELMVGDVIIDKVVDDPQSLNKGDIISFEGSGMLQGRIITHKIIKAPYTENGKVLLQTKGVANEIADDPIELSKVKGIMICEAPVLTVFYSIFLSDWGFIIIVALVLFIFIDELIMIVKILTGNDKTDRDVENINDIINRIQSADKNTDEDI